ncbi:MAG TPA: protein-methionine-sulfoxide reductase heme-binding subunit MsrQ [Gammaproteobacteria bacterium]
MAPRYVAIAKVFVWLLCLVPLAWLVARAFAVAGTSLGANPVETVLHTLGKTGLNLLLITLAVTPIRRLTGFNVLIRFRRLLGLFAFFYLVLHFTTYAVLDLRLQWSMLFVDITERPYITVGMLALAGMIPLALTSTQKMQRRLGRKWATLHKMIYPVAVLAIVHFLWQAKSDLDPEPLVYAGVLTLLLGYRLAYWLSRRRRTRV